MSERDKDYLRPLLHVITFVAIIMMVFMIRSLWATDGVKHPERPVWVGSFQEGKNVCYYTGRGISCVREQYN